MLRDVEKEERKERRKEEEEMKFSRRRVEWEMQGETSNNLE
jgi:hypothetical protein